jgi:hypothetical protein
MHDKLSDKLSKYERRLVDIVVEHGMISSADLKTLYMKKRPKYTVSSLREALKGLRDRKILLVRPNFDDMRHKNYVLSKEVVNAVTGEML